MSDLTTLPFDVTKLGDVALSPERLRDWLQLNIPLLVGPSIAAVQPAVCPRGTVLTVSGRNFAAARGDNDVRIGGRTVPVLAASASELRVLVGSNIDSGPLTVTVGTHTATALAPVEIGATPGDAGLDGSPIFAEGNGTGAPGDVNPIGVVRVLVVLCQANDLTPGDPAATRAALNDAWAKVRTFYDQASYGRTDVRVDLAPGAAPLDGAFADFVDPTQPVENILNGQLGRISAIAAKHAQDQGLHLDDYAMLCSVVFTNGQFVRAWGGIDTQVFSYDDKKPTSDPSHVGISISLTHTINLLWINESADWGRFAHEFGHNVVGSSAVSGDGSATLGEDVYGSDLVDPSAATASDFELMGNHDSHPIFSGYHLEKLGYYRPENIRSLQWDRNPHSAEFDLVAHGLSQDTDPGRLHILKVAVSDALTYYIEVRQRPGTTAQVFDEHIPFGASANQGGVIITRVIAGEMHNNQQTRFITLMHDDRVLVAGDTVEDPARALRITVVSDTVQSRPLVCKVRVEWAQTVADDPNGSFDLRVEPWDGNYQTPDIWIDRDPIGVFDNPADAEGRPQGPGDRPWVNHVNLFTARVHCSGAMGATGVKLTYYAVTPPGVGDNGNWAPIATRTIPAIAANGSADASCNWVPVVDAHSCLRVFAGQQLGEISGGNNGAQENIFDFQAAGASPADPVFIRTAIRNPRDEPHVVQLGLKGLPQGWAAQLPHSHVWLDAKAERQIDVMVWPMLDVNAYRLPNARDPGRLPPTAPIKLAGFIDRSYDEPFGATAQPAGSRFAPIGGTFYRVHVKRKSTLRIEASQDLRGTTLVVHANVGPATPRQPITVEVRLPDGRSRRYGTATTDAGGASTVPVELADRGGVPQRGPHLVQAFLLGAPDLTDAESNVLQIMV